MIKNELSLAYKAPEIKTITVEVRRCMASSPFGSEDYYIIEGGIGREEDI